MQNQNRTLGLLLAAAMLFWLAGSASTQAEPPLSKGVGCICAPSSHTYGYYPARWRRWHAQPMYGMPTPAMMSPQGEYTEEMPELLPPTNEGMEAPATIPSSPSEIPETTPAEAPDEPTRNVPDAAPPADTTPPNQPAAEPTPAETEPMQPALPPPSLPEDPLAPPAEFDDDPVPALPQSFRVPTSRNIPALAELPRSTRTRRYISPTADAQSNVDETGLPMLPAHDVNDSLRFKSTSPNGDESTSRSTTEAAPELIEPSPAAQPLDQAPTNKWTRHRQNPLRSGSAADRGVQQVAHWQTPAPAEPAIERAAPPATPRQVHPLPSKSGRSNPLR